MAEVRPLLSRLGDNGQRRSAHPSQSRVFFLSFSRPSILDCTTAYILYSAVALALYLYIVESPRDDPTTTARAPQQSHPTFDPGTAAAS